MICLRTSSPGTVPPVRTSLLTRRHEPAKESKKTNLAPILIIIVLMAAAGGGWFFMQTKKKKKAEVAPDPDADYTDDDEEDYGAGSEAEIRDSYDDEDPYENEILNDEQPVDDSEEDA